MAKATPEEYLQRLEKGIANAGPMFKLGVERSEDWEENYTDPEAQERMVTNLQKAIEEGKPAKGAKELGTEGWRAITGEKASAYTGSAKRAAENAKAKAETVIAAGEAARQAAKAVKGPKNAETALEKVRVAMEARSKVWEEFYAEQE